MLFIGKPKGRSRMISDGLIDVASTVQVSPEGLKARG